jgi:vacuolar iron transporter family protein
MRHREGHRLHHVGWLRAAVLGANDGIISTASLMLGVAAASAAPAAILLAGLAGAVAGAMSMAAGEYVSVRSQADLEAADLVRERAELRDDPQGELRELREIYVARGLTPELAQQVAQQLTAHDALGAHARDELGITDTMAAQPLMAALTSAASFALGAVIPLLIAWVVPAEALLLGVLLVSLLALALLGGLAARVGGANCYFGAARVVFWGAAAMSLTAAAGHWFGAVF